MRYAIIKDGFVTNVIEWDGKVTFIPDGELVQVADDPDQTRIGVGIEYKDNAFVLPVIPEPTPLTYDLKRTHSYPLIEDQLDMIFHAGEGGAEFQAAIKAVKDANPKPD